MGDEKYIMSSLSNALDILDLLSKRDNIGVMDISKALGISKSSIFKMLYTLEAKGFVRKDHDAKYSLGMKFLEYGFNILNNEKEIYYEKEHIINKKYDNYKNLILNKCKFNLIPVCKTCNSKKLSISMSDEFKENLNDLEIHCKNKTCDIHNSLEKMKDENFNPFAEDIKFDILHKVYFGNPKYIYQFKLNKRTKHIFQELFNFCNYSGIP